MRREIAVLVNPTAGRGKAARLVGPVVDRLTRSGLTPDVVMGRDAADAAQRLRGRVSAGVDGVVAVGGDGLVSIALQVLAQTAVPLGIVPAGTGNDVARTIGIAARDVPAAVDLVTLGATRDVDLGRADGRWFAGVLGAGFDSMVNERANRMSWPNGRSRYNLAIVAELRTFRPVPFTLHLDGDGDGWPTEAMLVAVGNGPSYGGGMQVCPGARLDDGQLDVTVLGPVSTVEFLRVFPTVYTGRHVHHPAVTVRRARRVTVSAAGVTAYADGERVSPLPVQCEAVPEALTVFAP